MTINLKIKYKSPDRESFFTPVASQSTFREEWLPASHELGLKLISFFDTGYPIFLLNEETIPTVVDEPKQLKQYFVENFENISEHYINRFTRIIDVLEQALSEYDEIEYVRI